MEKRPINIVWFKRDLRLNDHAPLAAACNDELPVLLMYVFEPSKMEAPDSDLRHWRFVWQSLQNINRTLTPPQAISLLKGEATDVFEFIREQYEIKNIFSHHETGNQLSLTRDQIIDSWCKQHGIHWKQFEDKGVIPGLQTRNGWIKHFNDYVSADMVEPAIEKLKCAFLEDHPFEIKSFQQLFWSAPLFVSNFQPGGPTPGSFYLQTFLNERSVHYQKHAQEPVLSRISSGRLSPYLAQGNISLRQVWQALQKRMEAAHGLRHQLESFQQRLIWHSHFVQKLATEPQLEFRHMNPGYDSMQQEIAGKKIEAWKAGKTGFPLVDASMRCLQETGYINFSLRAMLVSFFSHHLWQPWQQGAPHLAKMFLDYEPGIHYSQIQKQAAVTGVNGLRIHHPIKQSKVKDREGEFIQKWVPELRHLPAPYFFEPWKLSKVDQKQLKCVIGKDYPEPIVNLDHTGKHARDILTDFQKSAPVKEHNKIIIERFMCREVNEENDL